MSWSVKTSQRIVNFSPTGGLMFPNAGAVAPLCPPLWRHPCITPCNEKPWENVHLRCMGYHGSLLYLKRYDIKVVFAIWSEFDEIMPNILRKKITITRSYLILCRSRDDKINIEKVWYFTPVFVHRSRHKETLQKRRRFKISQTIFSR